MKLLLDTCLSCKAKAELEAVGHDVVWSGDLASDPGDDELLAWAHREQRILITLDKDFGELAVFRGKPHHGIIRLANIPAARQANATLGILERHAHDLMAGCVVTVNENRIRVRPPSTTSHPTGPDIQ